MKPLILVTNDDSYLAPGVHRLIDRLVQFGDVVAVCPQYPQSGKSMALTVNEMLRIARLDDYNGAKMYHVSGTPVDCVKLAHHFILDRPIDLVVSGINHGSNAAVNVLYSGTMGAAMEGAVIGVPSIGFSLTDHSWEADFTPCRDAIDVLVPALLSNGLPRDVALNVNVPDIGGRIPAQMRVCTQCRGRWNDEYREYTDPAGKKFYLLTGRFEDSEPDNSATDEWALRHGMISVVPVSVDRTQAVASYVPWLAGVAEAYNAAHLR